MSEGRPAFAVWLTGRPASGKSAVARALARELHERGIDAAVLESDALRPILTPNATYTDEDRDHFYRALTWIGELLVRHGVPVIFDATANRRAYRAAARASIDRFVEILVECPIEVCLARDPKGLYRRAAEGRISSLPGLQTDYEPPTEPDLIVSGIAAPAAGARAIVRLLEDRAYLLMTASARRRAI